MPALEPVESRILDNLKSTLAAITAGADYYTSVLKVHDMDQGFLQARELPAICVEHKGTPEEPYDSTGLVMANSIVDLYCVAPKTPTWRRDILRFAADVKKALRVDCGRGVTPDGQANAFDTTVDNTVLANEADGFPVALARLEVRVTFRYLFNDPTAAF